MLVGCSGSGTTKDSGETADTGTTPTQAPTAVDGEGFACLYGPEGAGDNPSYGNYNGSTELVDGGSTEVQVIFTTCASCPSDIETSCTATLQGSDLAVTATGSYLPPGPEVSCASVCVLVTAVCQEPSLPAGDYTISYGDTNSPLTVPGNAQVACAGDLGVR